MLTTAPRDQGLEIEMFGVTFFDTKSMDAKDQDLAERIYRETILSQVAGSESLLKAIYMDDLEGVRGGLSHFENGNSAWSEINGAGSRAVEEALGYWPHDAAHFEMSFS